MLAILIAVVMMLTKQKTPDQIENYSDLVTLFQNEKIKSFRYVPDSTGGIIELQVRQDPDRKETEGEAENAAEPAETGGADSEKPADEAAEEVTKKMTYDLFNFSVFYEDFHELIQEQYEAGIITEYEYEPGGTIPWWASFLPYLIIIPGIFLLWYVMMRRMNDGGAGGVARFSKARTRLGSEERLANAQGIYSATIPQHLCGKHLLLVDDVMTTGATMSACCQELQQAPDVRVSVFALALTQL
jgi:ATP-dependent Zn protease